MRKLLATIVTLALIPIASTPAHAEPKLGAVCKREGELAHMPTGLLVCAKVGKVLKYIKGQAGASGLAPQPIADKNIDPTVLKAFNAYDHQACKGAHPNFNATYLSSSTYKPEMVAQQKVLFEKAMSCYNNYFNRKVSVNIALLTEGDYEFLASQMTNGAPTFDAIQLRWAKFMMDRISTGPGRFAGSAGWSASSDSAWVLMIDSTKDSVPDAHVAAHEFVHILQSYSKSGFYPLYGDGAEEGTYTNLPNWFWEGTAELFSYASISGSAGEFSSEMSQVRTQAKDSPSLNKITTTAGVVSTLKQLKSPSNQEANMMMYALGSVAAEYVLATYGYSKYWLIMQNAGKYKDFDENLKATIGLSQDELFSKAAPFILSQWKLTKF